jgi:hypothetical protein
LCTAEQQFCTVFPTTFFNNRENSCTVVQHNTPPEQQSNPQLVKSTYAQLTCDPAELHNIYELRNKLLKNSTALLVVATIIFNSSTAHLNS